MKPEFESDVHTACRELEAQGKAITNRAVLKAVGRGSHTDVGPAIKSYEKSKNNEPPEWLLQLMTHAAHSAWAKFDEQSQAAIAQFSAALGSSNARIAELQQEIEQISRDCEEKELANSNLIAELQHQLKEASELVGNLSRQRDERLTDLQMVRRDLEVRLSQSEEKLLAQTAELDAYRRNRLPQRERLPSIARRSTFLSHGGILLTQPNG